MENYIQRGGAKTKIIENKFWERQLIRLVGETSIERERHKHKLHAEREPARDGDRLA
jgi:hypothetical protein